MTALPSVNWNDTHWDAASDDPSQARAELYQMSQDMADVINCVGDADGICPLDASALIPTAYLPTVPVSKGGTGATTSSGAITNLLGYTPMRTDGDTATGVYTINPDAGDGKARLVMQADYDPTLGVPLIDIENIDDGGQGVSIRYGHLSASPAAGDEIMRTEYDANDSLGAEKTYARQIVEVVDPTSSSFNAKNTFSIYDGSVGTWRENLTLFSTESVFNDGAADVDFRVEGDTATHLLFTDAANDRVGINESSPAHTLDVDGTGRFTGTLTADQYNVGDGVGSVLGDDNMLRPGASSAFLNIKGGSGRAKMNFSNDAITFVTGSGNYTFATGASNATDAGTNHIRFDSAGKAGFGDELSPSYEIDNGGDTRMQGEIHGTYFEKTASISQLTMGSGQSQMLKIGEVSMDVTSGSPIAIGWPLGHNRTGSITRIEIHASGDDQTDVTATAVVNGTDTISKALTNISGTNQQLDGNSAARGVHTFSSGSYLQAELTTGGSGSINSVDYVITICGYMDEA